MAKKSVWDDDYAPYGTYEGPVGSPEEWKAGFQNMFADKEEAQDFLGSDHPLKILGLDLGATIDQIKSAYRALAKQHHPDKGGEPSVFRRIVAAYKVLMG